MQAFFSAISHAQHHIYISSPYFLPNEAILTAVKVASLSGIDVRIMIPSRSDSKIVYWASRSYIGELIEANVKVYLYRKGFNHSKLIMIDGRFASVGTANMDIRSFEDNFEVSAILYDRAITESSRPISCAIWSGAVWSRASIGRAVPCCTICTRRCRDSSARCSERRKNRCSAGFLPFAEQPGGSGEYFFISLRG